MVMMYIRDLLTLRQVEDFFVRAGTDIWNEAVWY